MRLDDALGHRETEPGTFHTTCGRVRGLRERLKHGVHVVRRDADATVFDLDDQHRLGIRGINGSSRLQPAVRKLVRRFAGGALVQRLAVAEVDHDAGARPRTAELDRIVDDAFERGAQLEPVQCWRTLRHVATQIELSMPLQHRSDHRVHPLLDVCMLSIELDTIGVDLVEQQHGVHQMLQTRHCGALHFVHIRIDPAHFGNVLQHGEWRTEFMRHVIEEFLLHGAQPRQLVAARLDQLVRHRVLQAQ